VRNPARERSRNLNREVWESPSVYGGEDVKVNKINYTYFSLPQFRSSGVPLFWGVNLILSNC
ncbi:MAG: hypothetical protein LW635_04525, partial [Microcystis sp. 53598_E5]|nr:hypothetical protein [Microcystis sp. 53598_E5]